MGTQGISHVLLYIQHVGITYPIFVSAWLPTKIKYPRVGTADSAMSHQGLALSNQLESPDGAHNARVSHHVTCI
jgi:hypothetical protein